MTAQLSLSDLLPHRPPMLLVDKLIKVEADRSETEIVISSHSSFFVEDLGVPAWIGIEYMGQTAATIAGYQLQAGNLEPHIGLLLGTRKYNCKKEWFSPGSTLQVRCQELNAMGGNVATFQCEIFEVNRESNGEETIAQANLTVYRTTMTEQDR